MATVTTSTLPAPVAIYYDRLLLSMADSKNIFSKVATKKNLAARSGDTIRMERYEDIGTATVPLGNSSVTPPSKSMSSVFVDAQIDWYATWVEIDRQVELTSQSPVLNQRVMLLGRSMRYTEDELIREKLATTANVLFASGGTNGDLPTNTTLSDIQSVVRILLGADAKTVSGSIDGSNKFGTGPVPNAYIGLAHSDLSSDLENINGFLGTYQYGAKASVDDAEWGTVGRVRFLLSSRGSKLTAASGLGADVYQTFICGMEAASTIALENDNGKFIYHDARIAGGPVELHSTGGWIMSHASAITNDAWICNLKSTL